MQTPRQISGVQCRRGMSLVELLISTGIFGVVVAGSIASALLFARIAADHENRADFASDMRGGMEILSFDVRNANAISDRTERSFRLSFPNNAPVNYSYDNVGILTRIQGGQSREVLRSVSEFDILTGVADEPASGELIFDQDELSIENLTFSAGRGSAGLTKVRISNATFTMRND